MNAKKPIPIWSFALATVAALGVAAGVLFTLNPSADREALIKGRMKPGASATVPQADAAKYGLPKGAPVNHDAGNQAVDLRSKPRGR